MVAANVGPDIPLPVDGVVQIAFDRYLLPLTANRQGVELLDLFNNAFSPIIDYDPITRVLTLSKPSTGPWLQVGSSYTVFFPMATDGGAFGLVSVDGTTIDPATPTIAFPVGPAAGVAPAPQIKFCRDVFPIFATCSTSGCHGIPPPPQDGAAYIPLSAPMGLVLETAAGITATAIGVGAEETTTAAQSVPLSPQAVFPVGMPIVDPGYPANSYLLYKLLKADNGVPDASGSSPSVAPICGNPIAPFGYGPGPGFASIDEQTRLADLIAGRRMPYGLPPLTIDEMERLRLWILQGAPVQDCIPCPP